MKIVRVTLTEPVAPSELDSFGQPVRKAPVGHSVRALRRDTGGIDAILNRTDINEADAIYEVGIHGGLAPTQNWTLDDEDDGRKYKIERTVRLSPGKAGRETRMALYCYSRERGNI